MIKAEKINVRFGNNHIIRDISLEIKPVKNLVILGKNGSGKSVLLKCLSGLYEFYDGMIEIDGIRADNNLYYRIKNTVVSYVFQKGGLFDSFNVFDNIAFGLRRKNLPESEIEKMVTDALSSVGLSGNENKFPSELSGGMQKRVGLARAICMNPKVIMYDDPAAGLDPVLTDQIADLMMNIQKNLNITSVIVTHDLKLAHKIADDIMLIYGGKAVFYGSNDDFFAMQNEYAKQFITGDIEGPIDIY
ncbi:MAG: ATP-binding cassette domain-containing protein [Spirochaetes bacterium]|nr:ATP-binding cassette domain-containing protein [Spirochaetota bacterium]